MKYGRAYQTCVDSKPLREQVTFLLHKEFSKRGFQRQEVGLGGGAQWGVEGRGRRRRGDGA